MTVKKQNTVKVLFSKTSKKEGEPVGNLYENTHNKLTELKYKFQNLRYKT